MAKCSDNDSFGRYFNVVSMYDTDSISSSRPNVTLKCVTVTSRNNILCS